MKAVSLPRILLVAPNVFHPHTGGGVTLTNLFWGWPSDRLAMIYSEPLEPDTRVCQRFYHVGPMEFRKPRLLENMRSLWQSDSSPEGTIPDTPDPPAGTRGLGQRTKKWLYRSVVGDGLPEEVSISPQLDTFISGFQPDLIYTFLGSIPFMRMVDAIMDRYRLPLAVHIMDDWPSTIYRRGLFGPWLRPQVDPLLRDLLKRAVLRMGICDSMCQAYQHRYGLPFVPFHNAVDMTCWRERRRTDYTAGNPFRLVYAGSILPDAQLASLHDVAAAVASLHDAGIPAELEIHSPAYTRHYQNYLEQLPAVRFAPPPEDDTVAPLFTGADLLVLPVNFDQRSRRYIRYSMPTKVPAYLASGTPTLVYGPRGVAQVDYAQAGRWGYVVQERGVANIESAIRNLMTNETLRARLGSQGAMLAEQNHDLASVRPAFQLALCKAAC